MPFGSTFQGRRVLVTGDTGFKGSWLATWLCLLGAEVHGLGLPPDTEPALFQVLRLTDQIQHVDLDLRDELALRDYVARIRPDFVFHLAAQAIVRRSYDIPLETLATNFMGTAHLLDALGRVGYTPERPCCAVVVTSDKCYHNRETCYAYREDDPMGGHDVYSMSKGVAELLVASWRRAFFSGSTPPAVRLASCRAGNVIGGGDWAPDRIAVDAIRALSRGEAIPVRNPLSIRPWQHVLEPLSGYLQVAAALHDEAQRCDTLCSAWNFGPGRESERTVGELCDAIVQHWGSGEWRHTAEAHPVHEARFLKLAIDKAWHYLGWAPVWGFSQAVGQTTAWYRLAYRVGMDSDEMWFRTAEQIEQYMADARAKALRWMSPALAAGGRDE